MRGAKRSSLHARALDIPMQQQDGPPLRCLWRGDHLYLYEQTFRKWIRHYPFSISSRKLILAMSRLLATSLKKRVASGFTQWSLSETLL